MIVAVRLVRVVQVSPNEVIGVRGMWHRFVPATRDMLMADVVAIASMRFGALVGIGRGQLDDVFVDVVVVHEVKVTVVEIVDVPLVLDGRMRAAVGVFVRMVVVRRVFHAWQYTSTLATGAIGDCRERQSQKPLKPARFRC